MKRTYVRPTMVGERFVANEYVAACGDTEYGKYMVSISLYVMPVAAKKETYMKKLTDRTDYREMINV